MNGLNDFLAEIAPKTVEEPVAETPQAAEAEPVDTGAVAEPPTTPETAPAAPPEAAGPAPAAPPAAGQESKTVPLSALEDERNKRKDWKGKADKAEAEARVLRQMLEQYQRGEIAPGVRAAPQQPQAPQRPDVLQDPEGYTRHIEMQMQSQRAMTRRELSEAMMLEAKPDAAEVFQEFAEIARSNPALIQHMDQQINPAKFAYDYVKRSRVMQEIGSDPEAWKAQQLEALKAQWLAEQQAAQPIVAAPNPSPKPAPSIPPSLADARNVGARTGPAPSAPSFDETFAKKY